MRAARSFVASAGIDGGSPIVDCVAATDGFSMMQSPLGAAPLEWPPSSAPAAQIRPAAEKPTGSSSSADDFPTVCSRAIAAGVAVSLQSDVHLDEVLQLRRGRLLIVGGDTAVPPCISGICHSLFQLQGRAVLELRGVHLRHDAAPCAETPTDLRGVGAAVFVLNRASATLERCSIATKHGMGLWAVQRGVLCVQNCTLGPIGRSGVALFGRARAKLLDCHLTSCHIHGACARGDSLLELHHCKIDGCMRRGAYAYQRATMLLSNSTVIGTRDPDRAAVEAAGCREGDVVTLQLDHTSVQDNHGCGIRLRGAVTVSSLCHVSATQNGSCAAFNAMQDEERPWLNLEVSTSAERSTEELEGAAHSGKQGQTLCKGLATSTTANIVSASASSVISCPRLVSPATICDSQCGAGSGMPNAAARVGSQPATWRLWLGGDNGPVIGSGVAADVADEWRRAVSRLKPTEVSSA